MYKELQENKINKTKFHEDIDQVSEQFKGQILGQHWQISTTAYVFPQ